MRNKKYVFLNAVIFGWVALTFLLTTSALKAQAPTTMAGEGALVQVTSGTPPLASFGYAVFLTADFGSSWSLFGIYNAQNASGTYTYSDINANTGQAILTDASTGEIDQITLTYTAANQGTISDVSLNPAGYSQTGVFNTTSGTAPGSLEGKTFSCTVKDGLYPFATSGSYTLVTAANGNTYTISGPGTASSTGTYSYSLFNKSTAIFQLNDALTGSSTAYVGFTGLNSGGFAVKRQNGGFQVGSFTLSGNEPANFFTGQSSLGNNWHYLSFFGYYNTASFPYIYNLDMGWEYFFDAGNASHGAYFYDFADGAFFYTEPGLFPYIYDFKRNAWFYYSPQSGSSDRYSSNPRWFCDMATGIWGNHL